MASERAIPDALKGKEYFSKKDYIDAMSETYALTKPQIAYDLQKRLDTGSIVHVGWNKYSLPGKKRQYDYVYSELAVEAASMLMKNYMNLDFQIFELIQMNDFMNHQVAHNTIFVSVENELQESVFEMMRNEYPGHVMLRPRIDDYYRYLVDDEIIVLRLPTESPKGISVSWRSRLEKILVDVLTDKLISAIIPENEKRNIVEGASEVYLLDEDTMFRYARRKGAVEKFKREMDKYAEDTV